MYPLSLSAPRKNFLSASALVALALSAGMAHATITFVSSTGATGTTPDAVDNDFVRLQSAISALTPGQTLQVTGTFDLTEANAEAAYIAAGRRVAIDAKDSVSIVANTGAALIGAYGASNFGFRVINSPNTTIQGFEIGGFGYGIYAVGANGHNLSGLNINNNTITVRHSGVLGGAATNWHAAGIYLAPGHANANLTNITVQNNQFNLVLHEGMVERINLVANEAWFLNVEAMYYHFAGTYSQNWNNHLISNNSFDIVSEGNLVAPAAIADLGVLAGVFRGWRDNAYADRSNVTISGNLFDGSIELDGATVNGMIALWPSSRSGEFQSPDPGSRIRYTNNTFVNVATAARNWVGASTDANFAERVYVFTENTFIDCGIPALDIPVIRNVGTGLYGDAAPQGFRFDLDTVVEVGGVSMNGIEMLHYVGDASNQFFAAINTGSGYAQYGVNAAEVTPAADPGDIVNNPAWTGLPKFSDPNGLGTLAIGYNAFGDEIDPGDPNRFVGLSDNELYELTADEAFPVGTRIRTGQTLTVRSQISKSGRFTITPTTPDFATPLFVLEDATSTLILEDVILDGTNASLSPLAGNGGTIELDNVDIQNFVDVALSAIGGTDITATNTNIKNVFTAFRIQNAASNLTFEDGTVDDVNRVILFNGGGNIALRRNTIGTVSGFTVSFGGGNSTATSAVIGGAPTDGNIFMSPVRLFFSPVNERSGNAAAYWTMSHNWHANIYGPDANNDGYIDGDANIDIGVQTLTDGVRWYGATSTNLDILETSIVATFDRDNDGLADILEFRLGTNFQSADSSNNGVPDGVMVAAGLNPNSTDIPAGWTASSFTEDANNNRYVDWYEAVIAELGMTASLGDLTGNGSVTLGDAIRGLQIVNGAVAIYTVPNPNNLNVVGTNPFSLANPLQILRFQATVRQSFPALPGIQ